MGNVVLYMSMSVDGFIAGPDDGMDNGLGVNGQRLHKWLREGGPDPESHRPADAVSSIVFDEMLATGAVITGRRTFEIAGRWAGDHHGGVPIFVLTRTPPAEPAPGQASYVTDIEEAAARAKVAAGERDVMMHGAATAQSGLRSGVVDVLELHLIPVLLGQGRRLFDNLPPEHVELDLIRTLNAPDVTHLRYLVNRNG